MSTFGTPKSLTSIDGTFGWKAPGSEVDLKDILNELQGLRVSMALGGAQSAAQSLYGVGGATGAANKIKSTDVVLAAIELTTVAASGVAHVSYRGDVRSPSTGNVQFSGGATTNSHILVFWWDQSGYVSAG
jgi:hypothetical protein